MKSENNHANDYEITQAGDNGPQQSFRQRRFKKSPRVILSTDQQDLSESVNNRPNSN